MQSSQLDLPATFASTSTRTDIDLAVECASARNDLALALTWSERWGFAEGICSHFSVALSDDSYLVNPVGIHWSELAPGTLVHCSPPDGSANVPKGVEPTAYFIHAWIHLKFPDCRAILHTHMPSATALACITGARLRMISQNATRFFARATYVDEYSGLILDPHGAEALVNQLTGEGVVFLGNHGVLVLERTIARALHDLYYLDRACQLELLVRNAGGQAREAARATVEATARQFRDAQDEQAELFFASLQRRQAMHARNQAPDPSTNWNDLPGVSLGNTTTPEVRYGG